MGYTKTLSIITLLIALCFISQAVATPPQSNEPQWSSLTSYAYPSHIRMIGGSAYAATSGGLMILREVSDFPWQFSKLDGLGTSVINDVTRAADGQIWLAGDGRLIRFSGAGTLSYIVMDNDGDLLSLSSVKDDGDQLWIGSERGLILFDKLTDGGLIADSYELFGNLNPSPVVHDVLIEGQNVWVATSEGLAVADRSNQIALKAPASWTTYRPAEYPELESGVITTLVQFQGDIYIGTQSGFYQVDRMGDSLSPVPELAGAVIHDAQWQGSDLVVYASNGLWTINSGVTSTVPTPGLPGVATTGLLDSPARWLASSEGGVYYLDGATYVVYPYTGLPDNDVTDVTVAEDGQLTVLFRTLGPYEQDQGEWIRRPIVVRTRVTDMVTDSRGDNWIASFGGGISRVGNSVDQYNHLNSPLQESVQGSGYVACTDVATLGDLVVATNFEPWGINRVAVGNLSNLDNASGWLSLSSDDGITNNRLETVDIFGSGLAIGTSSTGLYYYDLGPDRMDKGDDRLVHFVASESTLLSDFISVVVFAPDGMLWIGTNVGLSRFNTDFDFFDTRYGPFAFIDVNLPAGFGPRITAIEFDSRGNVYLGAANGLARIDAVSGQIEVFTSVFSGLLDGEVANLTWNNTTGEMYVATNRGLSILRSDIGIPTTDLDSVYAFPNPFVISSGNDRIGFNFAASATLRVFTVAGELVAEEPEPVWNGRNQSGELVASGVYLFVLTDSAGNVGQGKFLLVRN